MDAIKFDVQGMEGIQAAFSRFTDLDRVKFFEEIFNPIGARLVREMQNETPPRKTTAKRSRASVTSKQYASRSHTRGNLMRSIGKQMGGVEIPTMWVSLNRKKGLNAWYQHMVVGGHEYGGTTVAPNPIVRRTTDKMSGWIQSTLRSKLTDKLKKLA